MFYDCRTAIPVFTIVCVDKSNVFLNILSHLRYTEWTKFRKKLFFYTYLDI